MDPFIFKTKEIKDKKLKSRREIKGEARTGHEKGRERTNDSKINCFVSLSFELTTLNSYIHGIISRYFYTIQPAKLLVRMTIIPCTNLEVCTHTRVLIESRS
jgi:hypothetical protein